MHRLADSGRNSPTASPSRVAVDETTVKTNGEWSWLYAAIDLDTKLILDVALFGRHGTDPAAAFLQELREEHDLSEIESLVDQFGYRTPLARVGLSGRVNYTERKLIEKWLHTLKMRIDRSHNSWVGSRSSTREWFEQFMHCYNRQRPHQALDGKTPIEAVQNYTVPSITQHKIIFIRYTGITGQIPLVKPVKHPTQRVSKIIA